MYRVKASALNIRRGPGTQYPVAGQLPKGALIEPVDMAGWLPVAADGYVGWVARQYLEEVPEPPQTTPVQTSYDFSTKEGTIAAIRAECERQGLGLPEQIAYVLATVEWETNRTFKPVREAYWKSEEWRRQNLRYYPYYGRGYVQLTWKANYQKYSAILGIDLVNNPDKALEPEIALFILVHGLKAGAFTGKKLEDFINAAGADYIQARRCVNALDRAKEIAALAAQYLQTTATASATEITEWPWLKIAKQELGVKEMAGDGTNPRIVEYLKSTTLSLPDNERDETPWCSAFVNWVLKQAGVEPRTNSAWARSWLDWGVPTDTPIPGTIAVFSRGQNGGHVGFYLDEDETRIQVLGGNQGNAVTIAWYPKTSLLGYREPAGWREA